MPLDIDRFAGTASPLQRWDPRLKIVALGSMMLGVALLKTLPMAVIALSLAVALIRVSALPTHFVSHWMEGVVLFLAPFFLIMPFTYPGPPAFTVLGLGFAWEGLRFASLVFIKAIAIVLISFSIFGSARFDVSMIALQRLRCPALIVQLVLFTYRYIFVFMEEMKTMGVAMSARGFTPRTDLRTMRVLGGYMGTLLVRSFERTDRVFKAMLSKGYCGELHTLVEFEADRNDLIKAALVIVGAILLYGVDLAGPFATAVAGWY